MPASNVARYSIPRPPGEVDRGDEDREEQGGAGSERKTRREQTAACEADGAPSVDLDRGEREPDGEEPEGDEATGIVTRGVADLGRRCAQRDGRGRRDEQDQRDNWSRLGQDALPSPVGLGIEAARVPIYHVVVREEAAGVPEGGTRSYDQTVALVHVAATVQVAGYSTSSQRSRW